MKRLAPLLLVLSSTFAVHAQKVDLSPDSLASLLCKNWISSYSLVGGMRLDMQPGAPSVSVAFMPNKSMTITTGGSVQKGTWAYDKSKKLVRLTVDGKSNLTVVALTGTELSMAADTKEATPDDPSQIIIVYKVKS